MSLQNKNKLRIWIKRVVNAPWDSIVFYYGIFVMVIVVLGGAVGYLLEEMKNKESVDFIFLLIQISVALAGFTFLAEVLGRGEKKNKFLLIRSSRFFLISAFLFFICFFSLYYPQSEGGQEVLGISIKNWNIQLFLILYLFAFVMFLVAFVGLLKVSANISDKLKEELEEDKV